MHRVPAVIAALILIASGPAAADVVIVDLDGIQSTITKIQDGLDLVSDGGTVYVYGGWPGRGVYRGPRNRNLTFGGKNVSVEALAGGEVIIDCEGLDRAFNLSADVDTTSRITGLTMINGVASGDGGAIRAEGALPVISECIFRDNTAASGGAIWSAGGPARLSSCDFRGNTAAGEGGAVYLNSPDAVVRASLFYDNSAGEHGAVAVAGSNPLISRCSFVMNGGATNSGIGIYGTGGEVEQCLFAFSSEGASVAAVSPEIRYCCVFGNAGGDDLPGDVHHCIDGTDPGLCGLYSGDLSLCQNSVCLPLNNVWHRQIGAGAQGCGECDSASGGTTWGSLKALFRY